MKVLVFNGTMSNKSNTANHIADYFQSTLTGMGIEVELFNIVEHDIPFFTEDCEKVPDTVLKMVELFRSCDKHIWLSPLYHGGMVGAMKNCLDWLIISAKELHPYLSHNKVGLVSWAFGGNAATGIDNMRAIANTLRAWTLPYSIPVVMQGLYEENGKQIAIEYQEKFERMIAQLVAPV
ncbi:NADPH-dependent FMN reductase [Allomuricauda sp. NBRC 101325]|uniref:NADPH-dependent FMN reductase n=1 Tax=Allomuricauda sp. NBRC 101325 TaxID=1113758 RepID=UPI0024A05430|nr:NAD(P)H-dependent oxidoreductase [Muricauda sp. NBRC 101325]GLU45399.1 hypothetical protein Musp01_30230 [Muricauda sp. NBRC 101325]